MWNYAGAGLAFVMALMVDSVDSLKWLLYLQAAISAGLFVVCCIDQVLFAATPPLPPSVSASQPRTENNFWADGKLLFRNSAFVILAFAYSVQLGTYSGWSGLLDPILVRV